jgi:hypothetical protein
MERFNVIDVCAEFGIGARQKLDLVLDAEGEVGHPAVHHVVSARCVLSKALAYCKELS